MGTAELVAMTISLISFVSGGVAWYSSAVRKSYAAERDFQHLRRNQEQLSAGIAECLKEFEHKHQLTKKELDEIEVQLIEVKGVLNLLLVRLTGDSVSEVLRRRKDT